MAKMPWYFKVETEEIKENEYIIMFSIDKFYLFLFKMWYVLTKVNFYIKWGKNGE